MCNGKKTFILMAEGQMGSWLWRGCCPLLHWKGHSGHCARHCGKEAYLLCYKWSVSVTYNHCTAGEHWQCFQGMLLMGIPSWLCRWCEPWARVEPLQALLQPNLSGGSCPALALVRVHINPCCRLVSHWEWCCLPGLVASLLKGCVALR